jgi:hypothetical protein
MPSAPTNDSGARALLTVNVTPFVGGTSWSASVTDNNASLGGFGDSGFWEVFIGPALVARASGSYDFGANSPPQYFPRSESGSVSLAPGSYTATGFFRGNVGSTIVGSASLSFPFNVPAPDTPAWSTTSPLPTATRGSGYSTQLSASPVTSYGLISSSGATGGLSLGSNGVISGTPTTVGTATFNVRAFNTVNGYTSSADRSFNITINPALPVFTDQTVTTTARTRVSYSDGVSATETASYSVFSGSLPSGLSLNTSTGAITGSPASPGTFNFVIRATNVTGSTNTPTLTITVFSSVRVWNGSAFIFGRARIWNGSSFIDGRIRVWNGSSWLDTK